MHIDLRKYAKTRQMPSEATVANPRQRNLAGVVDINLSQIEGVQAR